MYVHCMAMKDLLLGQLHLLPNLELLSWLHGTILECVPCESQLWANTKLYMEYSNNRICYKGWEVYLDH